MLVHWNNADAERMGALFSESAEHVGFDGSQLSGRESITEEMRRVFADHQTGKFVTKVKWTRSLGEVAALLRAVAGMIPPGGSDIEPKLNVVHTLVAEQSDGGWSITLFQNTPAQWHGRPEMVERHTEEIRAELLKER